MTKEEVFEDIQRRILNEEFLPGTWLVERDLVQTYGFSRTPIREIMNRLVMLGLLEVQNNRGYQIREFSFQDVVEIFNARRSIEGSCARFACYSNRKDIPKRIEDLRNKLLDLDIRQDGGLKATDLGDQVHGLLIELADNRYLKEFSSKLSALMKLTRNLTKHQPTIEEHSRVAHLGILDALEKKDAARCEALMDAHLNETCKALADNYVSALTTYN